MLKWKSSFETGIQEIDEQHQMLFQIGGELFTLVKTSSVVDHYDEITRLLDKLKNYTVYHFNFEEDLFEKLGYINQKDHKASHDKFVAKVLEVERMNIDENQKEVVLGLIDFVLNWVQDHILKEDFQYITLFKSSAV